MPDFSAWPSFESILGLGLLFWVTISIIGCIITITFQLIVLRIFMTIPWISALLRNIIHKAMEYYDN